MCVDHWFRSHHRRGGGKPVGEARVIGGNRLSGVDRGHHTVTFVGNSLYWDDPFNRGIPDLTIGVRPLGAQRVTWQPRVSRGSLSLGSVDGANPAC